MSFYNKTLLLPNLESICDLLNNKESNYIYFSNYICNERTAIKHWNVGKMNIIRIWNTRSFLDYWYNEFCDSERRFIGALDYTIHDNYIKIEYLCINDGENYMMYDDVLETEEAHELIHSLINYVKILANKENKPKIVMNVHGNLRLYDKYYSRVGFETTNNKCIDNPYWVEIVIVMNR